MKGCVVRGLDRSDVAAKSMIHPGSAFGEWAMGWVIIGGGVFMGDTSSVFVWKS